MSYVSEVADALGIAQHPGRDWFRRRGIAAGLRDGFLVAVHPNPKIDIWSDEPYTRLQRMIVVVRAGKIERGVLDEAEYALTGLSGFLRRVEVDANSVTVDWRYALLRPSPGRVKKLVEQILDVLRAAATPVSQCDGCGLAGSLALAFVGPQPELLCAKCREGMAVAEATAAAAQEAIPLRFGSAFLAAAIVALVGSEVIARLFHDPHVLMPFFLATAALGLFVGMATRAAAGKAARSVRCLACLATAAGVWIALFGEFSRNGSSIQVSFLLSGPGALVLFLGLWFTWLPVLTSLAGVGLVDFIGLFADPSNRTKHGG